MTFDPKINTFFCPISSDLKDKIDVEIGDSKQPVFFPQMKIMRFDNEVNFSARLIHAENSPVVSKIGDVVKWNGLKMSADFYELSDGFEFEVILKEKPITNKVEFTINTKGLDFFYQPELTEDEKNRGAYRPENVVGSYAVYMTEHKVNYVGGNKYRCGKVGHIYRPKIEDAKGNWVWGELNIDVAKGILSVTILQKFLDNAVYPVRHAAGLTFGYTTSGSSTEQIAVTSGSTYYSVRTGQAFAAPENGTITDISISTYTTAASATDGVTTFSVNQKDSVASNQHGLIGSGEATINYPAGVANKTWKTISSLSISITNATNYILNAHANAANLASSKAFLIAYDSTTGKSTYVEFFGNANAATAYSNSKENPWTYSVSDTTRNYSIYATYTSSAPAFNRNRSMFSVF